MVFITSILLSTGSARTQRSTEPGPMSFEAHTTGGNSAYMRNEWIQATGAIVPETPAAFQAFIEDTAFPPNIVRLSSKGGDLGAGLELGRLFREFELETEIGKTGDLGVFSERVETGSCESSCAYAFLGGVRRLLDSGDILGFHQFLDIDLLQDSGLRQVSGTQLAMQSAQEQAFTGRIVEYLIEMGIDLRLYQLAATVPPGDMLYLETEEAGTFGVENFSDVGGPWEVIAFGSGLVAEFWTRVSDRKFRLYCTENGAYHLTVIKKPDNIENEEALLRILQSPDHPLLVSTGKDVFPISLEDSGNNADTGLNYYVFRIDEDTARKMATASQWRFQIAGVMRGFADYIAVSFGVTEISGDSRLPTQVMRTCI